MQGFLEFTEEKKITVKTKNGGEIPATIKVTGKDYHIVKTDSGKQYKVDHQGNSLEEETEKVNEMDYGNDDNSPPYHGHGYPKGEKKPSGPDVYVKKAQKVKDAKKDMLKTLNKAFQQTEETDKDLPFTPDAKKTKPSTPGKYGDAYSTVRNLARKALEKQAKKPVKEEAEELEELDKSTLSSYVSKAAVDVYGKGLQRGSGDWKKSDGKKLVKRVVGIQKAAKKLAKEEAEQIDELKKSTLASYAKKSAAQLPAHQTNATLKHTGPIANAHSGKHPKTGETPVQYDDRKVRTRQQGIIRAVDKLAKEEAELEEANFADTMKKAIAAHERGDHTRAKYHLDNAKTARYAMKSTEISKHKELLDKYKEMRDMHEEVELEEAMSGGERQAYSMGRKHGAAGVKKINADKSFGIHSAAYHHGYDSGKESAEWHSTQADKAHKSGAYSEELEEGKMGQLSADIGSHIDKHVDDYKSHGGAEHLMSKIDHTAKKIATQHGLEHKHAHKFVSDYVEKKLHEGKDYSVTVTHYADGKHTDHEYTVKNANDYKHAKHIAMQRHGKKIGALKQGEQYSSSNNQVKELEETKKLSTAEKLDRGLKRGGYDSSAAADKIKEIQKKLADQEKRYKEQGTIKEDLDEDITTAEYKIKKYVGQDGKTHQLKIRPHRVYFKNSRSNATPETSVEVDDKDEKAKIKEEADAGDSKHRILVTLSNPNHTMVTQRKEKIQKHVRISAASKEDAVMRAKAHYKKRGYKVHDAEHVGMIKEAIDKKADLRAALARHEQHAVEANKRGDDEAVKTHQNYINKIKTKMAKLARSE